MKKFVLAISILASGLLAAQNSVKVVSNQDGQKLEVDGKPMMINGMNWDYFPVGTNYSYSLWKQSDDFIQKALDDEMSLLKNMGVNVIRQYMGIPSKWIKYIYEKYGIYTVLNHSFGRYGLTIDGAWVQNTDYANPKTEILLLSEVKQMVAQYKNTPGLLMFLLGNENNYGLFWEGAETEDIPVEERKSTQKAKALYQLFNKAAVEMKSLDTTHPVAMCNGDLLFLDIIAKECQDVDVLAVNAYRGSTFTDAFQRVKKEYGKPLMFSEFGADAFNAKANKEDQKSQAYYDVENWKDIYSNAAGLGKSENCIGGFTFQFSDGWWKYKQTENLGVHDSNASWSNGGYQSDFEKGENNMNEEWFGICAKGKTDASGHYELYPRAAYYALKQVHQFNPYEVLSYKAVNQYFNNINYADSELRARGDKAAMAGESSKLLEISRLSANFTTYNTGGSLITTEKEDSESTTYPNRLGFDHTESFFVGVQANPSANVRANAEFNILGNVALNPIDEIFYENKGRPVEVTTANGTTELEDVNRISLYKASINWNSKYFDLDGFYRTGHYHWGYEGDMFGLYREANYGSNIDIYNGIAPVGTEIEGKRFLKGLTLAYGPQLWWGANPAILVKYRKNLGKFTFTGIYHEDIDTQDDTVSSFAVPTPQTRRVTLAMERKFGKFGINLGGIWAGQPLNGRTFQLVRNGNIYQDEIKPEDNWGGKVKLTYNGGNFKWYGQGAVMGLVANGGSDQTQTFTGWSLKDSGSGNQYNAMTGFAVNIGKWQIAPNFLWQKPIEGPVPSDMAAPARPRNVIDDPFAVRSNREMTAGEILFTYDPTPATWMYAWDSDRTEDAPFAFSAGFVFRDLPTTQDAAIGIFPDGRTTFAFPGAAPAKDLWEAKARIVSKINTDLGLIANLYGGNAQANGSDERTIERMGMDLRVIYKKIKLQYAVKFNDWGPYDYHRDFNLTFPFQTMLDISTQIGKPDWFILPSTKIGIRATYRTLNQYSPRYAPTYSVNAAGNFVADPMAIGFPNGNEWEIRTYIQVNLGK